VGIYAGNAGGTGFTLCDFAYLLEYGEVFSVIKANTEMVYIWSDAVMFGINRRYTVARLIFPIALDTFWSLAVVAFLLKVWRCMQIKYYGYCGSDLGNTERR
jgi:hypothetical protein